MTYSSTIIQENAKRTVIYPGLDSDGNLNIANARDIEGIPVVPNRTNAQADYVMRVPADSSSDDPSWVVGSGGGGLNELVATSGNVAANAVTANSGNVVFYNFTVSGSSYLQDVSSANLVKPLGVQPSTRPQYWFEIEDTDNSDAVVASGWLPLMGTTTGSTVQAQTFEPLGGIVDIRLGRNAGNRPYFWQFRQSEDLSSATRVKLYASA